MAFDAQLPGTEPDGQTDGLRNVQHRNIDPAPEVAVDRLPAHIEVRMAHRTGHDDRLSTPVGGVADDLPGKPSHDIGTRHRKPGAAAFGLESPVDRLGPDQFHQRVEALRVFQTIELQHPVRTYQQATVVARHLAVERLHDPRREFSLIYFSIICTTFNIRTLPV